MPRRSVVLNRVPYLVNVFISLYVTHQAVSLAQHGPVSLHEQREGLGDLRIAFEQMIRAFLINLHSDVVAVNANACREHYGEKCGQRAMLDRFFMFCPSFGKIYSFHFLYHNYTISRPKKKAKIAVQRHLFPCFILYRAAASAYPKNPEYRQPFSAGTPGFVYPHGAVSA